MPNTMTSGRARTSQSIGCIRSRPAIRATHAQLANSKAAHRLWAITPRSHGVRTANAPLGARTEGDATQSLARRGRRLHRDRLPRAWHEWTNGVGTVPY